MLNYETLLVFVYFLILCGGQSTLNSCIRSTTIYLERKNKDLPNKNNQICDKF